MSEEDGKSGKWEKVAEGSMDVQAFPECKGLEFGMILKDMFWIFGNPMKFTLGCTVRASTVWISAS